MIRRNDFSVSTRAEATQRSSIDPSFQRLTRPVRRRIPEFGDSITFVVHRHRRNAPAKPRRFTVNVSAIPSRKLPAADGCDISNIFANSSNRATAHAQLGGLLAEIGQYDGAVTSLRAALKLDPKLAGVRYNLGTVLAHLNRWAEAVAMFEEAVAESPEDAELHNNLGFALARTGRADQAVGCFERALALDPQHADAHFNLARTLTTLGRIGEAAQHLQEAARLDPRYAPLLTTSESSPRVPAAAEQSQPD